MQTGLFEQISQYHTTLKTQNRRWHSPPPIIWGLPPSQKHEQPELGPCLVHSYNSELHVALHEQPPMECPGTGLGKALPQNTSHTGPGGRMVVQLQVPGVRSWRVACTSDGVQAISRQQSPKTKITNVFIPLADFSE